MDRCERIDFVKVMVRKCQFETPFDLSPKIWLEAPNECARLFPFGETIPGSEVGRDHVERPVVLRKLDRIVDPEAQLFAYYAVEVR
jgi:hypothetical protein